MLYASPPRPELDLYGVCQPPFDQIKGAPAATEDFGLPGHFRLKQQRVIVNLRGDEDCFLRAAE
jgi:hypothetical protein